MYAKGNLSSIVRVSNLDIVVVEGDIRYPAQSPHEKVDEAKGLRLKEHQPLKQGNH